MLANCMQIAAHNLVSSVIELKTVTFIAGRSENPAEQKFLIRYGSKFKREGYSKIS